MAGTKRGAVAPDEFCDDGETRMMNPARAHGVVYSAQVDGKEGYFEETKYVQDGIAYRGDRLPVGYKSAAERGKPTIVAPPVEEVLADNERLQKQVNAQQGQIADLIRRLEAIEMPAKKVVDGRARAAG